MTGENVNKIRAADTPATMKPDRIPPRLSTNYHISFVGAKLPQNAWVTIRVLGQSNDNGRTALFSDAKQYDTISLRPGLIDDFYQSTLTGTMQTAPGNKPGSNAGNLVMAVLPERIPSRGRLPSSRRTASASRPSPTTS